MEDWVNDAKLHLNCNRRTNVFILHFQSEIKGDENWAPWNLQKYGSQESYCTQAGESFYQTWHGKHLGDVWGQSCVIKYKSVPWLHPGQTILAKNHLTLLASPSPLQKTTTQKILYSSSLQKDEKDQGEAPTGSLGESGSHALLSRKCLISQISTLKTWPPCFCHILMTRIRSLILP